MFDGCAICIEILFFDYELIAEQILYCFIVLEQMNQKNRRSIFFMITPYAILTPGMSKGTNQR